MSLQLQNIIKPFSTMSSQEQLDLIARVRHNRFTVRDSAVKKKAVKTERKTKARKKKNVKDLMAGMSKEDKIKLLKQMQENQ